MEGGVQRPLGYLQDVTRDLTDALGDRPPVLRLQKDKGKDAGRSTEDLDELAVDLGYPADAHWDLSSAVEAG